MKRGPYHKCFAPNSNEQIPRSTKHRKGIARGIDNSENAVNQDHNQIIEMNDNEFRLNSEEGGISGVRESEINDYLPPVGLIDVEIPYLGEIDNDDVISEDELESQDLGDTERTINSETNVDQRNIDDSQNGYLNDKLCGCTSKTIGEVLLMCMTIDLRHSLLWIAIVDILSAINVIFEKRVVPDTKFLLCKYFHADIQSATYHLYCSRCRQYIGETSKLDVSTYQSARRKKKYIATNHVNELYNLCILTLKRAVKTPSSVLERYMKLTSNNVIK